MLQTDTPVLVGVGVLSIGAMCVGLAAAWYSGRRYAEASPSGDRPFRDAPEQAGTGLTDEQDDDELAAPRHQVRERTIRIVALVFLASVAALVGITHRWQVAGQDTEGDIFLLVAAGTLAVVFLQDLLPASIPDGVHNWVKAGAAVAFLTVLVGLSGGLQSPFVLGFVLVVGSATLSRDGLAPFVLALVGGLSYGAVGLLVGPWSPEPSADLALIGFVLTSLLLLAFMGSVASREQRRARDAALQLARFDPLTGLYNRTHFFATMEREVRLAERAGRGFALLMLDLDGLKPVNDSFGHHYGDRLLQAITEVIRRSVRATDTPARYGGDEFVILLPDTDAPGGYVVAEKLRKDVAALSIRVNDRSIRTSVSIGLVAYPDDGATVEELMAAVDAALYEAKRGGKDRIVGYTTRTERVATRMDTSTREPVVRETVVHEQRPPDRRPPDEPPPDEGPPDSGSGGQGPPDQHVATVPDPVAAAGGPGANGEGGGGTPPGASASSVSIATPGATIATSGASHAPWETASPASPSGSAPQADAARPIPPPGITQPPVPRRLVAFNVEGGPAAKAAALKSPPAERR